MVGMNYHAEPHSLDHHSMDCRCRVDSVRQCWWALESRKVMVVVVNSAAVFWNLEGRSFLVGNSSAPSARRHEGADDTAAGVVATLFDTMSRSHSGDQLHFLTCTHYTQASNGQGGRSPAQFEVTCAALIHLYPPLNDTQGSETVQRPRVDCGATCSEGSSCRAVSLDVKE